MSLFKRLLPGRSSEQVQKIGGTASVRTDLVKQLIPDRPLPSPATAFRPSTFLGQNLETIPLWRTLRGFWNELTRAPGEWILVLPLLVWIGWRTYRKERKKVLKQRLQMRKP